MQINRINPGASGNTQRNNKAKHNNTNTSFKGPMVMVDKAALKVADLIENGGLFVSFTLQDMLGTNLPRPLMGLKRNAKENKGE